MTSLNHLQQFRQDVYDVLCNAHDALFDLMDTVLVSRSVSSLIKKEAIAVRLLDRICDVVVSPLTFAVSWLRLVSGVLFRGDLWEDHCYSFLQVLPSMISKRMLFIILWLVGMVGVLSTIWIALPIPAEEIPLPLIVVKLLNLITPTFLLSVAVLAGVNLASKVGLSAPFAEALASGAQEPILAIKPQVIPGLVGGVLGGVAISTLSFLWRSSLPVDFVAKAEELFKDTPLLPRILYGGITEEILMRWGLMTLLVWVAWRVLQKAQGSPHAVYVALAIGISALAFGLAHLPLAFMIGSQVTASLVTYIIIGNGFFGLIAGYLYWQKGLESAMIAHATVHVVITIIDRVQSYR